MNTNPQGHPEADVKNAANDLKNKAATEVRETASEIREKASAVSRQTKEAYNTACQEAGDYMTCANDAIRNNPLPAVAGAFAFGIAIGCLIMSGRSAPTFQDRYFREPLDDAAGTLGRLYGNLKFW